MIFTSEVADRFCEHLKGVLDTGGASEDQVRYALVTAIREVVGIADNGIRVEYPHPNIKGAKLDGFLPASEKHGACAWELKYDRATPGGGNQPRSNKAGAFINDFFRLAGLDDKRAVERVVIYLTDAEMASYLQNPSNGFKDLFSLSAGERVLIDANFLKLRPQAVKNKVKAPIVPCYAIGKVSASLPRNHRLRLYEVRPAYRDLRIVGGLTEAAQILSELRICKAYGPSGKVNPPNCYRFGHRDAQTGRWHWDVAELIREAEKRKSAPAEVMQSLRARYRRPGPPDGGGERKTRNEPDLPQASRAELALAFQDACVQLEGALKNGLPAWQVNQDRRSLGNLIREASEKGLFGELQVREGRFVNVVRNALFHSASEKISDDRIRRATESAQALRAELEKA